MSDIEIFQNSAVVQIIVIIIIKLVVSGLKKKEKLVF